MMAVGFAMAMMFRHTGIEEARSEGSRAFLEVLWSCSDDRRGIGAAGCRGLWNETMEPDWFTMPTPPRTSGSSCSRVELPLPTHK
jgi:hypothetical protein